MPSFITESLDMIIRIPVDQKNGAINRHQLGQKLFANEDDPVCKLDQLITAVPVFLRERNMGIWELKGVYLEQVIIQSFITWLAPIDQENRKSHSIIGINSSVATVPVAKLVRLTTQQKLSIVNTVLKAPLKPGQQIWNQLIKSIHMRRADMLPAFLATLMNALRMGMISLDLLTNLMLDSQFNKHFRPDELLLQAILIGPLSAHTVEVYCLNRPPDFRAQCRAILIHAESLCQSNSLWSLSTESAFLHPPSAISNFPIFCSHVRFLMRTLRGEPPPNDRIHLGWAFVSLRKATKRYYLERTWPYENMHELIWSLLSQRPEMKGSVLRVLSKEYKDDLEARKWRDFDAHSADSRDIQLLSTSQSPVLLQEDNVYLTLPIHVASNVMFVDNAQQLQKLQFDLDEAKINGQTVIGLDAEWSAYIGYTSILQLATETRVYIIDMEPKLQQDVKALSNFLEHFFQDEQLLKIGYSFREDLYQLRAAIPTCHALYTPKRLFCINEIIRKLTRSSKSINDLPDDQKARCSLDKDVPMEDVDREDDKKKNETEGMGKAVEDQRHSRGLSGLCEQFLGRALDKTEQCSVWNRRPLRPSQTRYAALDAYCLLMLFRHCRRLAIEHDKDIFKLIVDNQYQPTSLPLFVGDR